MLEEMEAVRVLAESKSVRVLAGKEGVGRNKRCWEKRLVLRVYKDVGVLAEKQGVSRTERCCDKKNNEYNPIACDYTRYLCAMGTLDFYTRLNLTYEGTKSTVS
jgi:hypothetical protein